MASRDQKQGGPSPAGSAPRGLPRVWKAAHVGSLRCISAQRPVPTSQPGPRAAAPRPLGGACAPVGAPRRGWRARQMEAEPPGSPGLQGSAGGPGRIREPRAFPSLRGRRGGQRGDSRARLAAACRGHGGGGDGEGRSRRGHVCCGRSGPRDPAVSRLRPKEPSGILACSPTNVLLQPGPWKAGGNP